MYDSLTDEQLIKLVAKKDKMAYNELYNRYKQPIYNYLNRLVFDKDMLDEIFQEVFTKIYLKASTFKIKYNFKSWIYKISMNQYIDYYKRLKRKEKLFNTSDDLKRVKYNAPDTIEDMIKKESLDYLEDFLKDLPDKFQQAIILKKIQGLTFNQVAEIMGVTSRSVKTYVAKGLELLKTKFDKLDY